MQWVRMAERNHTVRERGQYGAKIRVDKYTLTPGLERDGLIKAKHKGENDSVWEREGELTCHLKSKFQLKLFSERTGQSDLDPK